MVSLAEVRRKRDRELKRKAMEQVANANIGVENSFISELRFDTENILKEYEDFGNEVANKVIMYLSSLYNADRFNIEYIEQRILEVLPKLLDTRFSSNIDMESGAIFPCQFVIKNDSKELLERLEIEQYSRVIIQKVGQALYNWIGQNFIPEDRIVDTYEFDISPAFVNFVVFPERGFFVVNFDLQIFLDIELAKISETDHTDNAS